MRFNGWTFLFEVLNFVVLAYLLHRLLYRPLRAAIDGRKEATARAQAEADKARQEAEVLQRQLHVQLADLENHRQETVRQALEEAERQRQQLLATTEQALEQRREECRQAMENERREALNAVHREVVAQAVDLTRRLLSEASDQSLDRQLALHLVQALRAASAAERAALQAHAQADGALLETARELDGAILTDIANALTAAAGMPVSLTVQARPALLGGVRLRVGGQVWDGSLAGQLPQANQIVTKDDTP